MNNYVHDNNNPNVPGAGSAAAGPVGTGMSVSGGRNDTIMNNRFVNNNAWGVIFVPYPDSGTPCTGGTLELAASGRAAACTTSGATRCSTTRSRTTAATGTRRNGDFEQLNLENGHPTNCFSGNTAVRWRRLTPADAAALQTASTRPARRRQPAPANINLAVPRRGAV